MVNRVVVFEKCVSSDSRGVTHMRQNRGIIDTRA